MIDILCEEKNKLLSVLNNAHAYATEKEIEKCLNNFNFSKNYSYNQNLCCKNRFCIGCQKKRQILWYFDTLYNLKKINNDCIFVTFEIEEKNKLVNSIDILQNSFNCMINNKSKVSQAFNYLFSGGIHSVNISYNTNTKLWNVKIDCILILNAKAKKHEDEFVFRFLCQAWQYANCSTRQIIQKNWGCVKINNDRNIENYCSWLCNNLLSHIKVAIKTNEQANITELLDTLKNRHLIQPFGILKTHNKIDYFIHFNYLKTEEFIKDNYKQNISLTNYNELEINKKPIKYSFTQSK